ncbi:MAG: tyramine oxidase subunit B [Peptoniphilaceae bacterium]|uniref:tyramine oxidase subunit B n=1 Tax=Parvimonas sp. TaxID=1944660 RepID=UPI002A759ABB|nr:tyramine oxidase subunit B [Parvimonas sp.]MDD7764875.1 tyramine oxidase subunit B [Peptoniphilaceae bacterium]MDY3050117.1 tyramine oxidase subunit B [Parvimonas sp.]
MDNGRIDFLYLSEDDMIKAGVRDMKGCIESMEETFRLLHKGDYRMGGDDANEHGIRVSFPKESDIEGMPLSAPDYRFMAMPAYLGGKYRMFGIKSYGSNPNNRNLDLPRSILMLSLMDVVTGAPIAYMSANILSSMRTGAVAGLGAKYLSKKEPKVLSIIGPGTMSIYSVDSFIEVQPSISTIKIKGRGKEKIDFFINYVKERHHSIKEFIVCDSVEEACKDSDIIYFGTTNAKRFEDNPYINESWVKKGALVMSASALLIDTDFLANKPSVRVVADNYKMYSGWGAGRELPTQKTVSTLLGMGFYDAVCENKISREDIIDLGAIICGEQVGRENEDQILIYAVGGMPVEDVAWGYEVYQKAIKNNVGVKLNLWDSLNSMR